MCLSPICIRCGLAVETADHAFYRCPANRLIGDEIIEATDFLCRMAEASENKLLYVRGLVPQEESFVDPPAPHERTVWSWTCCEQFLANTWFTDGAGGSWGRFAAIRRCGAAVVGVSWKLNLAKRRLRPANYLSDVDLKLGDVNVLQGVSLSGASDSSWGEIERWTVSSRIDPFVDSDREGCISAFATAPIGGFQSVPRSEVLAATEALLDTPLDHEVTIVVDALAVIKGVWVGPKAKHEHTIEADWRKLWHSLARRDAATHFLWVKSHCNDPAVFAKGWRLAPSLIFGNSMADHLAGKIAADVQVPTPYGLSLAEVQSRVRNVHDRMVVILMSIADFRKTHPDADAVRPTRPPRVQRMSPLFEAAAHGHSLIPVPVSGQSERWACVNCGAMASDRQLRLWRAFAIPCQGGAASIFATASRDRVVSLPAFSQLQFSGRVTHFSHGLKMLNGALFCGKCGALATGHLRYLADACVQVPVGTKVSEHH